MYFSPAKSLNIPTIDNGYGSVCLLLIMQVKPNGSLTKRLNSNLNYTFLINSLVNSIATPVISSHTCCGSFSLKPFGRKS